MSVKRSFLPYAILLFIGTGCGLANLENNIKDYNRLVVIAQKHTSTGVDWWRGAAKVPLEAKLLMRKLRVRAVFYSPDAGTVYIRRGGGYLPEYGYEYRLAHYDSLKHYKLSVCAEQIVDRWYKCAAH